METIGGTPILEIQDMRGKIGIVLLTAHAFRIMLAFYRDTLDLQVSNVHPGKCYELLVDWVRFELEGGTVLELPLNRAMGGIMYCPSPEPMQ